MIKAPTSAKKRICEAAMRLFAEHGHTQVSIHDLAEYAGVTRSTIHQHIDSIENLFTDVAATLAEEINQQVIDHLESINDPALRMAYGIRLYVKRAHDEPSWGLFMTSFALTNSSMQTMWAGYPAQDIMAGIQQGRYQLTTEQVSSALAQQGSAVIAAICLVRQGIKTWREAGSMAAELMLRAYGVPHDEAHELAYCKEVA